MFLGQPNILGQKEGEKSHITYIKSVERDREPNANAVTIEPLGGSRNNLHCLG